MKQIFQKCLATGLFFLGLGDFAGATTIERDLVFDLTADWNYGRIGTWADFQAWEGTIAIDDLSFTAGDTFIAHIRFANDLSLQLADLGKTHPAELIKMTLLPEEPINNSWNIFFEATYIGVAGDLLINPIYGTISGGGGALLPVFHSLNLTNTAFSYVGIDFTFNFDSYLLNNGSGVFNRMEWSSGAEHVSIIRTPEPVPEPTTLFLFGTGIAGLAAAVTRTRMKRGSFSRTNA